MLFSVPEAAAPFMPFEHAVTAGLGLAGFLALACCFGEQAAGRAVLELAAGGR